MFGYKAGICVPMMRGATLYPVAVFDAAAALELVERERITMFPGPPTVYQMLLDHPDRATRASRRCAYVTAVPTSPMSPSAVCSRDAVRAKTLHACTRPHRKRGRHQVNLLMMPKWPHTGRAVGLFGERRGC
ncbi:MAG: hypothetical protein U0W40_03170 [Acidimicrobiia bacterium]